MLRENKIELTLFLVLFLSFAYFYQGGGSNQNARLGQMRVVAEKGQLHFQGIRVPSHDIVNVNGKIYPNKAPGVSLSGIAPYFLISRLKRIITGLTSEDFYHLFSCYLMTALLVALPCALGGVVFFRLLGLFHPACLPRLICTLGLFLGTPAFAYSTVLYGHMVSSVLTIVAFYLLYKYLLLEPGSPRSGRYIFLAGLASGWAVVTEYPTALIVTMLALYCFIHSIFRNGIRSFRFGYFILGLLLPAGVMIGYNYLVFDNPLYIAYFDEKAAPHTAYQQGGILGLNIHARQFLEAIYQTSFGPFRGLFHLSPLLILIAPGVIYFAREKGKRVLFIVLWILVATYFLINSIYPYWYGGRALGARHAMEVLPYIVLLAFYFIVRFPRFSSVLVLVSIFFMLTATSIRPEEYVRHPFRDLYFYAFFNGNLSLNHEATFQTNAVISSSYNAFNLGEAAGMKGQLGLIPLYLTWLIGGIFMIQYSKKEDKVRGTTGAGETTTGPQKLLIGLLVAILVVGVLNLLYQLQLRSYLEELSGAGQFRLSAAQAPPAHVQIRTSPGHRIQVWEVKKPHSAGETLKVKVQHADSGTEGGFYIVAYGDKNNDGKPDIELGKSPFLTARSAGDWSYWTVSAPEGRIFVGNTWNDGARVFFDRKGWSGNDFYSTMYYATSGAPILSTGPRSTNMAVEIMKEETASE